MQISSEAKGESWSEETSSARNHKSSHLGSSNSSSSTSRSSSKQMAEKGGMKESQTYHGFTDGAVSAGGYQVGICVGALKTIIEDYCRGVLSQQVHSTKQGSSRQLKRISLIGNKPRTQWREMTCLPLKEGNMLALEAAATLALLLALFPPRTLPQAPLVVLPTPFQGTCNDLLRLNINVATLVWAWVPQVWEAKWLK